MHEDAPVWAYESVQVCRYDARWPARAKLECEELADLLAPWLAERVEHIGSTAVPGLAAKPIVDLMASVSDLDVAVAETSERLAVAGWCFVPPDLDRRPWRRFFVKPDAAGRRREAHLHLIQAGNPRWVEQLRFRDALRADSGLAQKYADLKHRLAESNSHDREAYSEGKAEFVARVLGDHSRD